ncbi:MAG: hypothetical protein AAFW89_12135 [Bacteroidota bacterium]
MIRITRRFIPLLMGVCLFALPDRSIAQSLPGFFNYEEYPEFPIHIRQAELDLKVNPDQRLISGDVYYQLSAKVSGISRWYLHAANMEIEEVKLNDEPVDYRISGDSLIISSETELAETATSALFISWQSRSEYGIHVDATGTLFTSLNPFGVRHWLPVFDHPRVEVPVVANITVPATQQVIFNGELFGDEVSSADRKTLSYRTETAIPVTGLSLVVGDFVQEQAKAGIKSVHVFTPSATEATTATMLLEQAVDGLKKAEAYLNVEYPWSDLKVVLLPDSYLMERSDAAGVVYVFEDLGDKKTQLVQGILAQWMGQGIRSATTDHWFSLIDHAQQIWGGELDSTLNIDLSYSEPIATQWSEFYKKLLSNGMGYLPIHQVNEQWYQATGQSLPEIKAGPVIEDELPLNEAVVYRIDVEESEIDNRLRLVFELVEGEGNTLHDLKVTTFSFGDSSSVSLSITGETDTLWFEDAGLIESIRIQKQEEDQMEWKVETYPLMLALSQLRSPIPDLRAEAAYLLQQHTDNPDLQLAINDALATEEYPQAKAAMLSTLSQLTDGAIGTEQVFLDALRQTPVIQEVALQALTAYSENEMVENAIRSFTLRTPSDSLFMTALGAYRTFAGREDWQPFIDRLLQTDSTGYRAVLAYEQALPLDSAQILESAFLEAIPELGTLKAIEKAVDILNVRSGIAAEERKALIVALSDQPDPRMRILAISMVGQFEDTSEQVVVYRSLLSDEFDPRLQHRITQSLKELAEIQEEPIEAGDS